MKYSSHETRRIRRSAPFGLALLAVLTLAGISASTASHNTPQAGWRFEIEEGKSEPSTLSIKNTCSAPHLFRVNSRVKYLSFAQPTDSILVGPNATKDIGIRFDATGLKPETYRDKVTVVCIDCKTEKTCRQDRDELSVEMVVMKAKQTAQPPTPNSFRGRVVDPRNTPVSGAQVRIPGRDTVLTDSKGEFSIRGLAATERLAASFSATGFMDTTRIYKVGESSRGINTVVLWPRAARVSLDARRGGKLTFPGGTVNFPARALVDERGRAINGKVRVSFSALDVSDRRQLRSAPGDFTARMRDNSIRQLETFGVFEVFVEDASGRRANLAPGRNATVELSIPQELRRRAPASVGLFSFDQNSGRWIEEGTIKRPPGRTSYEVLIPNITPIWNADIPHDTTCITLKILKEDGTPAPVGTRVEAEGVDYSGTSPTGYVTNSMGEVCLSVKKCPGTVRVVAYDQYNSAISSCPVRIQTPCQIASAADCGNPTNCPLQPVEIILPGSTPGTFYHDLNGDDPGNWEKAHNWTNWTTTNNFYDVWWYNTHVVFNNDGIMRLRLDNTPPPGPPQNTTPVQYSSGEYRTKGTYGYGTYEVCMKPAKGSGLMTSFFTYTNTTENPPSPQHDEIDIEFRGMNTQFMWTNFFFAGNYTNHEVQIPLGFDAADDFHRYKFVWTASEIKWYVDGVLKRTETHAVNDPLPIYPGKIMVNLWSGNSYSNNWLGTFTYLGTPIYAEYDWIRYKP